MKTLKSCLLLMLAVGLTFVPLANADELGPKETYQKYKVALDAASKIEDLSQFLAKHVNDEIAKTPADMKPMMFGFMKETAPHAVQILKETVNGNEAVLTLSAKTEPDKINGEKVKEQTTGTCKLLKESGSWKIDKESWNSKVEIGGTH